MYKHFFKRILDILCALLALTVFLPLYLILIIAGAIAMKGNPFFTQPRPGYHEKIFKLIKFRTMTNEKDEHGELLPDELRLNKYGKFLRSTSLDEIPEAINILKGEMSVIGPRPQLVRDMAFMTNEQRMRHSMRPGLSGLAQTKGRNALSWDEKLELDLEYIQNVSFTMDVKIVMNTVKQVFFKQKGIERTLEDEVEIVDDFGDYLLKSGRISEEEYQRKMNAAKKILQGQRVIDFLFETSTSTNKGIRALKTRIPTNKKT